MCSAAITDLKSSVLVMNRPRKRREIYRQVHRVFCSYMNNFFSDASEDVDEETVIEVHKYLEDLLCEPVPVEDSRLHWDLLGGWKFPRVLDQCMCVTSDDLVERLIHVSPTFKHHQSVLYWVKQYHENRDGADCSISADWCKSEADLEGLGEVWRHGTTRRHAATIVRYGPTAYGASLFQDFSHGVGFYVSSDAATSREWAETKSSLLPSRGGANDPVEVIMKRPTDDTLDRFGGLDLSGSQTMWQKYVSKFRRMNKNYFWDSDTEPDYVVGPMSANGSRVMAGETPISVEGSSQICVHSEDLTNVLYAGLVGVIDLGLEKEED